MLKFVNKSEYMPLSGAKSIPDGFDKLVIKASNYINHETQGRIDKMNVSEQVKYATCLIMDLMNEEDSKIAEIGNLKSENIEGWDKTFLTPEQVESDYSTKKYEALKECLWDQIGVDGKPLLYCGVC